MKYMKIALSVMAAAIVLTGCVKNPSEKGVEYLEDGKYKEAIEQFQDAIDSEVNAGMHTEESELQNGSRKTMREQKKRFRTRLTMVPRRLAPSIILWETAI